MAPHSSILAWRIPGMREPGGLPSMGSHRVGQDWSDLAAATACTSKVKLNIVHLGFNSTWTENFQMFKLDLKKAVEQIASICWIIEKARKFQKNIYFCFIDYTKAFDCVGHNTLLKILQLRLQQYVYQEIPYVQAGFRKCRGTKDQIADIFFGS